MDLTTLLSTLIQGMPMGADALTGPNVPAGQPFDPMVPLSLAGSTAQRVAPQIPLPVVGSADVYHGAATSTSATSPSLLALSGVSAYVQLVNTLSTEGTHEKAADPLAKTLLEASATLKSAYSRATSRLPPQLQAKDWRFSVSNGRLVFTKGRNELTAKDFADLKQAFAGTKVESAANQVAAAITSMRFKRDAGADSGSLAWGRFEVNETNFEQVVDLRAYLTATAPGGEYNPGATDQTGTGQTAAGQAAAGQTAASQTAPGQAAAGLVTAGQAILNQAAADPATASPGSADQAIPNSTNSSLHHDVPMTLGGMYLGDLVTSKPNFFKTDTPPALKALESIDTSCDVEVGAILQGRCSCGEVRFTVEDEVEYAFYCHCSRCRLRTGSVFAAVAAVGIDKVQVTAGDEHLLFEGECSDGYGARCGRCHAFLFAAVRGRQYLHISLGVLAGKPSRLPDHHIYVGSKAPWYQITDGLPQYDELP